MSELVAGGWGRAGERDRPPRAGKRAPSRRRGGEGERRRWDLQSAAGRGERDRDRLGARVSPDAATPTAAGAGAGGRAGQERRGAREGENRMADEPNDAINGRNGEVRSRSGQHAGEAAGLRRGTPAELALAAAAEERHETRAQPWSDRPATPHAGARRRRAVRGPKVAFFRGVVGGAATAGLRDRERASEPPRRGGCSLSLRVMAGRAGGSRRTTGRPAASSSSSARSAHRSTGAGSGCGEGEEGTAAGAAGAGASSGRGSGGGEAGGEAAGGESPCRSQELIRTPPPLVLPFPCLILYDILWKEMRV